MKIPAIAVLIALTMLQQPPAQNPQTRNIENAYRANNRGVALLEQFNYDGATAAFREALKTAPDLSIAKVNLAIALFYASKNTEAADAAKAAVVALPASATSHYMAGLIAKTDNRVDEAASAFERVLQLDPIDPGAKIQLGQIRTQERRFADAITLFQDALKAEPYNVTAAYSLGLALTRAGRADEGRQAMQRFDTLRSSAYGVTYAQTYLSQGRYAEALTSTGSERALVNRATPAVSFSEAASGFLPLSSAPSAADIAGAMALVDIDGDGDLDIVDVENGAVRLLRNDGRAFTDRTTPSRLNRVRVTGLSGVVAGDYDNDTHPDLVLFGTSGYRLLHQAADGGFDDVSASAKLPDRGPIATAAFVDVDHDGDLDIAAAGAALQLFRNNGDGTFTEITTEAGLAAPLAGRPVALAPTDFDNRRDIDLVIAGGTRGALLYRNMRDGTFRDASSNAGLRDQTGVLTLAIADVNKDGYPDLFLGRRGPGILALSDGKGTFNLTAIPDEFDATVAAQFVDYDNDGLLDLVTLSEHNARIFRNVGSDGWVETTSAARLGVITPATNARFQSLAVGDLDGDGDDDIVVRQSDGRLRVWRNDGGERNASLRVRLTGRVSNRSALGVKVDLRAGSLRQTIETAAASPAVSPADVIFGLGSRAAADAVRVLWPSGIVQAETPAASSGRSAVLPITELDRKPSSCPYLFTWNGTRFEFVTDFMGGGEMGDWVAPSVWNQPDPDEYVRIGDDQLKARNGRYELRITNELEEVLFVDRLQLIAVDHRADAAVYPNEGLREPPRPPFTLISTHHPRPPLHAIDEHGHDVLSSITSLDRQYPDDFGLLAIRGYAAPHSLTLDLGPTTDHPVVLLTGWTDYAFSSDNVAASQGRLEMKAPSLQVKDAAGQWQTVIADVGFPVGRPQTVAVDLTGKFLSRSHEVRLVTNMRIYWDQIQVADRNALDAPRLTRLDATVADLHWRGFSRETTPDGREPFRYDYEEVSTTTPWKVFVGRYTREGDVRALLRRVDDMFVISRPGDEIALSFDAGTLPPLPAGWTRSFLLHAHGYSKEMNPRSASPDTVGPLPFRAMTQYPYGPDEHYPDTRQYREYQDRYNTRGVSKPIGELVNW